MRSIIQFLRILTKVLLRKREDSINKTSICHFIKWFSSWDTCCRVKCFQISSKQIVWNIFCFLQPIIDSYHHALNARFNLKVIWLCILDNAFRIDENVTWLYYFMIHLLYFFYHAFSLHHDDNLTRFMCMIR